MKKLLSLVPALLLACFMSVSAYETASAQTFNANQLTRIGDSVTFDIQAGEWKNGTENFVGTYTITKVNYEQFTIDYEAAAWDENSKVEFSDVKIWVNDTGEFRTSPGNQKGQAFAVEPGETFSFSGEQMYVFFHANATYWQRKSGKANWKRTGEDSATGYDVNGRIANSCWFMSNTVAISNTIGFYVYYISLDGVIYDYEYIETYAGDELTIYARNYPGYTLMSPYEMTIQPNDGDEYYFFYTYMREHVLL